MRNFHKLILRFASLTLVFAILFTSSPVLAAVDTDPNANPDIDAIYGYSEFYDPNSGVCGDQTGSVDLTGGDIPQKVFNYFVSVGLAPFQAAGILGNMQGESGVQPLRLQGTPSGKETPSAQVNLNNKNLGWGLVQWTPASKMIAPTRAAGKNPDDLQVQLEFIWAQLTGNTAVAPSNEKAAGDHLKATTNVVDAAVSFLTKYERPANPAHSRQFRIQAAEQALKQYGNGAPSGTNPNGNGCSAEDAVPNGDAQALASYLVGQWGKNLVGNDVALQDLKAAAAGQKIQNSSSCGNAVSLDLGLLQTLATIITKYKVTVWNIVSGHGCDRFYHPKGAATDLGGITELSTGQSSNFAGNNPSLDGRFVLFLASILPPDAGLGESNCPGRSNVKSQMPPHIRFFSDTCNHQHIQMRTSKP